MWTQFWDMHSGGGLKEKPYHYIYIEAPQKVAEIVFQTRFGHNPHRVTCPCCGEDYAIDEDETLEELTGYHRGCHFDSSTEKYVESPSLEGYKDRYQTIEEYVKNKDVLVISAKDIKPEETAGELADD